MNGDESGRQCFSSGVQYDITVSSRETEHKSGGYMCDGENTGPGRTNSERGAVYRVRECVCMMFFFYVAKLRTTQCPSIAHLNASGIKCKIVLRITYRVYGLGALFFATCVGRQPRGEPEPTRVFNTLSCAGRYKNNTKIDTSNVDDNVTRGIGRVS